MAQVGGEPSPGGAEPLHEGESPLGQGENCVDVDRVGVNKYPNHRRESRG